MKKVLFVGVTKYDLNKDIHLKEKFEGLSREINPYVLAKGKPFHKENWGTEFFLLPPGFLFWPLAFCLAFYLCLIKKIDTIIAQSPLMEGFVGSILKKILRKELIVEIHGDWLEGPFLSKKRKFEKVARKIIPILAKISFRNADKIRAVSNYLTDKAREIAPEKRYFLFPTFTDVDMFLEEKEKRYENFILFVGALERVKGVECLIEAFHIINFQFSIFNFQLIIIGDGSERKNLENLSKELNLEDKVEFKGRLSLEETKDIMKNCYCLVLPSLSEGLPRVLLEAMALERAVIGSNAGGIPDLIKDGKNGFLFEKGNSDDLAKKLEVLLENKNLTIEIGRAGKKFIQENFSNKKYVENYIQMINN